MASDLHYIVQVNASKVHQRGSSAAGRMAVNELVFLDLLLLGRTSLRGFNLHQFSQSGILGDILDVAIDDLVGQVQA